MPKLPKYLPILPIVKFRWFGTALAYTCRADSARTTTSRHGSETMESLLQEFGIRGLSLAILQGNDDERRYVADRLTEELEAYAIRTENQS